MQISEYDTQEEQLEASPTLFDQTRVGTADNDVNLHIGTLVARYVIVSRLGSGGMGIIYLAYDPELDRRVALKLLKDTSPSPEAQKRLLREAKALAKLQHPNVVAVYDSGTWNNQIWIVMEYIKGQTLTDWLRERSPKYHEVIRIMRDAAKGLIAAHTLGLVHRDVKPDNVMISNDSRVRVMDFGLVGAERENRKTNTLSSERSLAIKEKSLIREMLTHDGDIMGTPAYMAPEQFFGAPTDSRTDQFSWCATTWEALFGERPFAGETLWELALAVTQGSIQQRAAGNRVPRWLRRVLERGLSNEPERRFGNMEDLLRAISRGEIIRTRLRIGLAVTLTVLIVLFGWIMFIHQRSRICDAISLRVNETWSDTRRTAVKQAIMNSGRPFAETTWQSVSTALDTYAEGCVAELTDACAAAEIYGTQSPSVQARRYSCADTRFRSLDALINELLEGKVEAIDNAANLVAALPALSSCHDEVHLLAGVAAPGVPIFETVSDIRGDLSVARARQLAGDPNNARTIAEMARAAAKAVGYPPLHAEADLICGRISLELSDFDAAERDLEAAYHEASRLGHDEIALEAMLVLSSLEGKLARYDVAETWIRLAEDMLVRLDRPARWEGEWLLRYAKLNGARGFESEAMTMAQNALVYLQAVGVTTTDIQIDAINNIGIFQEKAGRLDDSMATLERGLEIVRTVFGEGHPSSVALINNRASLLARQGHLEEALVDLRAGLSIRSKVYGEDSPPYAFSLGQIGDVLTTQGHYSEAITVLERALAIQTEKLKFGHVDTAGTLISLGKAYYRLGRSVEALRVTERAHRLLVASLGESHPRVISAEMNLAVFYLRSDQIDRALTVNEAALEKLLQNKVSDHRTILNMRNNRAEILVELGRLKEAIAEREAIDADAIGLGDVFIEAKNLSSLARIYMSKGDFEKAIHFLTRARELVLSLENREFFSEEVEFLLERAQWSAGIDRVNVRLRIESLSRRLALAGSGASGLKGEVDSWLNQPWSEGWLGDALCSFRCGGRFSHEWPLCVTRCENFGDAHSRDACMKCCTDSAC